MTPKAQPKIAIFVNHPECSVQSAHGIIRALSADYDIDCIGTKNLTPGQLGEFNLVAFPGGLGDSETYHRIIAERADVVRNYVESGGHYLGICMGAYWAGPHYFNLLKGVDTQQYIKRPNADVLRSFGTVTPVTWLGRPQYMYFYDGCSLVSQGGRFRTIARYSNHDPAAIIQGRVGVIGPHPESDVYWYAKPYMQPYWHEYRHHSLLLNFVKSLIK